MLIKTNQAPENIGRSEQRVKRLLVNANSESCEALLTSICGVARSNFSDCAKLLADAVVDLALAPSRMLAA